MARGFSGGSINPLGNSWRKPGPGFKRPDTVLAKELKLTTIQPLPGKREKALSDFLHLKAYNADNGSNEERFYQKLLAKREAKQQAGKYDEEFVERFHAYLSGAMDPLPVHDSVPHTATPAWGNRHTALVGKIPGVKEYLDALTDVRFDYEVMKYKLKKFPNWNPITNQQDVFGSFLYFKYVLEGESLDHDNFMRDFKMFFEHQDITKLGIGSIMVNGNDTNGTGQIAPNKVDHYLPPSRWRGLYPGGTVAGMGGRQHVHPHVPDPSNAATDTAFRPAGVQSLPQIDMSGPDDKTPAAPSYFRIPHSPGDYKGEGQEGTFTGAFKAQAARLAQDRRGVFSEGGGPTPRQFRNGSTSAATILGWSPEHDPHHPNGRLIEPNNLPIPNAGNPWHNRPGRARPRTGGPGENPDESVKQEPDVSSHSRHADDELSSVTHSSRSTVSSLLSRRPSAARSEEEQTFRSLEGSVRTSAGGRQIGTSLSTAGLGRDIDPLSEREPSASSASVGSLFSETSVSETSGKAGPSVSAPLLPDDPEAAIQTRQERAKLLNFYVNDPAGIGFNALPVAEDLELMFPGVAKKNRHKELEAARRLVAAQAKEAAARAKKQAEEARARAESIERAAAAETLPQPEIDFPPRLEPLTRRASEGELSPAPRRGSAASLASRGSAPISRRISQILTESQKAARQTDQPITSLQAPSIPQRGQIPSFQPPTPPSVPTPSGTITSAAGASVASGFSAESRGSEAGGFSVDSKGDYTERTKRTFKDMFTGFKAANKEAGAIKGKTSLQARTNALQAGIDTRVEFDKYDRMVNGIALMLADPAFEAGDKLVDAIVESKEIWKYEAEAVVALATRRMEAAKKGQPSARQRAPSSVAGPSAAARAQAAASVPALTTQAPPKPSKPVATPRGPRRSGRLKKA